MGGLRLARDLVRYTFRQFTVRPALSCLTMLSLCLGIGVNAAVGTVAYAIFVRPLPYERPHELVHIWRAAVGRPSTVSGFFDDAVLRRQLLTAAMVLEWRARKAAFDDVAAIQSWQTGPNALIDVIDDPGVDRVRGALVTPNLFSVLGVRPALGRTFADDEENGVMISEAFWRRRLGGRESVLGADVTLAHGRERQPRSYKVIGVLPAQFQLSYPEPTDLMLPLRWRDIESEAQNILLYQAIARLSPGLTVARAEKIVQDVDAHRDGASDRDTLGLWLEPVQDRVVSSVRVTVYLIGAMSLIAFLIACLNIATVFVASIASRRPEIAIRFALGSSRAQMIRYLIGEMALLATLAALITIGATWWALPILRSILPVSIPRVTEIGLAWPTVVLVCLAAVVSVLLAGGIPALFSVFCTDGLPAAAERSGSTARVGSRRRLALVSVQIALVSVLLAGSGLLLKTYYKLGAVDAGFDPAHLTAVEMRLLHPQYRVREKRLAFERQIVSDVNSLPGVVRATITSAPPFRGVDTVRQLRLDGADSRLLAYERYVSRDYFEMLRIPLLRGRLFGEESTSESEDVVVVSQSLARALYPEGDPVGKPAASLGATIIGIVGDVRTRDLTAEAMPALYLPRSQARNSTICLIVKSEPWLTDVSTAITGIIRRLDAGQPIQRMASVNQILAESIADRRLYAFTSVLFGVLMLTVSVVGVAGIVALSISARLKELAIRAAVGASKMAQVWTVISHLVLAVSVGTGFGLCLTLWTAKLATHFFFGIEPWDSMVISGTIATIALAATAAVYPPLRRLMRLQIAPILNR